MNHYTLAEMTPGLTEEFTVTVTPEMMDAFRAITGDVSPIHIDADYAKGRGFPGRVVYGMLGASFFSTLAGVYLPGDRAVSRASGPVRWRMARRGVSGSCSIFSTPRLPTRTRVTDFCIPHSSRW